MVRPGSTGSLAGEFFAEREINSQIGLNDTQESLWEWLREGAESSHSAGCPVLPHSSAENIFYRGQSNADHGLSSSLFRVLSASVSRVTEYRMAKVEEHILKVMRGQGLGRLMTDGQLLGLLQHHGIPTRLIDVSKSPLEALFFAVDQDHDLDGRLFVIQLHPSDGGETDTIDLTDQHQLEWADAARGEQYAKSSWTGRVAVIDPQDLDPRMRAQQGCFLVGGLIASYSRRQMQFRGHVLAADDLAEITTLSIRFPQRNAPGKAWSATAWTVRIPARWKRPLSDLLRSEKDPITKDTMYPPLAEVKRLAISKADELSRATWVTRKRPRAPS
ncbi:FRG domain-containing protein (plasmid) [Streptomyces europaeiscabiei]|uniref:FRG domain-containing protein n=1 Tax=Streptomyces europaeiscabiei TaxID=146819 RepID=UPI002E8000D3|nr:FRG domain-containing protein [Streptomyces europaeiscabiei]WUD38898.1 FRG domain-containing protein [Streptomyces europaeiscabiei]